MALRMLLCTCSFLSMAWSCLSVTAQDEWPQFRGPQGNGYSAAEQLPTTWSETENITWKTPIEGLGHSSPVISGNQIWLTTSTKMEHEDPEIQARIEESESRPRPRPPAGIIMHAVCVDVASGEVVHQIELMRHERPQVIHSMNSYASPTSVIEEGRLYCHFGAHGTAAVDTASGEILWTNQTIELDHEVGPGSSPILWNDLLILNCDGYDVQYVAALNKRTGELAWKTDRTGELETNNVMQKAFATPHIVEIEGREVLVSQGADWVYGYDPATGEELWKLSFGELGFSGILRPLVGHGMFYLGTGFGNCKLIAVRYDGSDGISEPHIVWECSEQAPKRPGIALVGEQIFMVSDNGILTCLDALTGDIQWKERIGGNFSSSPLYAGGLLYYTNHEGQATVLRPGAEYDEVATNELDGAFKASPAVIDNSLILRTDTHLYRIDAP